VKLSRQFFSGVQKLLAADRFWFFDESGLNLSYARLYGRSQRGERVIGRIPNSRGDTVTLMAGIGCSGLIAPMILHGSLTGEVFAQYFEQHVIPSISKNDIIVIDNLSAHKTKAVAKIAKEAGVAFLYLPPYSPDLNPIELAWTKLKTLIRGHSPRTMDRLINAVSEAMRAIDKTDIINWVQHCGYTINA
jgi:transposase